MRFFLRILLYMLLALFSYRCLVYAFGGQYDSIFTPLLYMVRMGILAILMIVTWVADIKAYRKYHNTWYIIPPVFAVVVLIVIVYKDIQRGRIDRMKNELIVSNRKTYPDHQNGFTYYFKKGKYFSVVEHKDYDITYYGRYSLEGDRIYIKSCNYSGKRYELPEQGIIRDSMIYWNNSDSMKITLIDPPL